MGVLHIQILSVAICNHFHFLHLSLILNQLWGALFVQAQMSNSVTTCISTKFCQIVVLAKTANKAVLILEGWAAIRNRRLNVLIDRLKRKLLINFPRLALHRIAKQAVLFSSHGGLVASVWTVHGFDDWHLRINLLALFLLVPGVLIDIFRSKLHCFPTFWPWHRQKIRRRNLPPQPRNARIFILNHQIWRVVDFVVYAFGAGWFIINPLILHPRHRIHLINHVISVKYISTKIWPFHLLFQLPTNLSRFVLSFGFWFP